MVLPNEESAEWIMQRHRCLNGSRRSPVNTNASQGPLPTVAASPGTCNPFAAACLLKDGPWSILGVLVGVGGEAALTSGATNHQTEHKAEICQRKILNSTVLSWFPVQSWVLTGGESHLEWWKLSCSRKQRRSMTDRRCRREERRAASCSEHTFKIIHSGIFQKQTPANELTLAPFWKIILFLSESTRVLIYSLSLVRVTVASVG